MAANRTNEFGEKTSDRELVQITARIRKLAPEKMDALWAACGFVISGREEKYAALRQADIDAMLKSLAAAKEVVWNLIAETRLADVRRELARMES